jgi:hypothetical protein
MIAYPNSYDKIVIVCYTPMAGGKFLINNLGLNDRAVFQDATLARRQINGDFSYNDKLRYLSDQLENTLKIAQWTDLGLGCDRLFGFRSLEYQIKYPKILVNQFDPTIQEIISENLFLFLVAHNTTALRSMLNFWTNAKVIRLSNSGNFINTRTTDVDTRRWGKLFENEISEIKISKIKKKLDLRFYQIDVDEFYKDEHTFLSTLKDCLQWLDLPMPQNDHDNRQYFLTWKEIMALINTPDQGD